MDGRTPIADRPRSRSPYPARVAAAIHARIARLRKASEPLHNDIFLPNATGRTFNLSQVSCLAKRASRTHAH